MDDKADIVKTINRICIFFFIIIIFLAIYIMSQGTGTEGSDYGPGSYYYSDIPNWEAIFYPEINE
ncbi:hypothetical protein HZY91_06120 [Facklamia sp. DSM 111018]|uniref:Uncharacterized protein n=1 Tax=Facklamia lactis TaxID=2749967 RepID=A0ABS0LR39_9LACT|nr:hypothetical protein [Facklamia lactis]MBG9980655.1 hypothetical protein [Facklamia lactis]MBG9986469.1 hypothetical protein [Facklamia lactis]